MDNQLREHDILAYIEGDLDDARARQLEAAIAQDPELSRFVQGARADRENLQRWGQPGTTIAPQGLVRDAMRSAERDALLETPITVKRGVLARIGGPRLAAAAAIVMVVGVGVILGPAMLQQNQQVAPSENTLASADQPTEASLENSSGGGLDASTAQPTLAMGEDQDVDFPSFADDDTFALADEANEGALESFEQLGRTPSAPSADAALRQSIDALSEEEQPEALSEDVLALSKVEESNAAPPESRLQTLGSQEPESEALVAIGPDGVDAPDAMIGMTLDRAWALAMRNLLTVTIEAEDPRAIANALVARPDIDAIVLRGEPSSPGPAGRVECVVRLDNSYQSLVSLLETVRTQQPGPMRLIEAQSVALVPTDPTHLVWWDQPIDRWRPSTGIAVRVVLTRPVAADPLDD